MEHPIPGPGILHEGPGFIKLPVYLLGRPSWTLGPHGDPNTALPARRQWPPEYPGFVTVEAATWGHIRNSQASCRSGHPTIPAGSISRFPVKCALCNANGPKIHLSEGSLEEHLFHRSPKSAIPFHLGVHHSLGSRTALEGRRAPWFCFHSNGLRVRGRGCMQWSK